MSVRSYSAVALVLLGASLAGAQQRGTMEFGAFGSAASFDQNLGLTNAIGGGGRIGMFLDPHWTIEFEDAEMKGNRPNGLNAVNVGILSGRLVAIPFKTGALSILVGVGAGVSTETNFLHSYGYDGLVGAPSTTTCHSAWTECSTGSSATRASPTTGASAWASASPGIRVARFAPSKPFAQLKYPSLVRPSCSAPTR